MEITATVILNFDQKTARNIRIQRRYDQLLNEGKHGHYEAVFKIVDEEVQLALRKEGNTSEAE